MRKYCKISGSLMVFGKTQTPRKLLPQEVAKEVSSSLANKEINDSEAQQGTKGSQFVDVVKNAFGKKGIEQLRREEVITKGIEGLEAELGELKKGAKLKEDKKDEIDRDIATIKNSYEHGNYRWTGYQHQYHSERRVYRGAIAIMASVILLLSGIGWGGYFGVSRIEKAAAIEHSIHQNKTRRDRIVINDIKKGIESGNAEIINAANQITGNKTYGGNLILNTQTHANWIASHAYTAAINGKPTAAEVYAFNDASNGQFGKAKKYKNSAPWDGTYAEGYLITIVDFVALVLIGGGTINFIVEEGVCGDLGIRRKYKNVIKAQKQQAKQVDGEAQKIHSEVEKTTKEIDALKEQKREISS